MIANANWLTCSDFSYYTAQKWKFQILEKMKYNEKRTHKNLNLELDSTFILIKIEEHTLID